MIETILAFIQQNSEWAFVIIFIVAFLESIAIVGLFVPGWLLLVGVGTLIGADVLMFYPIAFAAYAGAVIGEYLSYLIGYRYHDTVLSWAFVAKHEKLINKSREFFEKHGVSGVFIGRFFGPTRAVVPLIAGISEMRKITFFWVNIISGLIWAPLYLIPGILIGAAVNLEANASQTLIILFVLIAIGVTIVWNYSSKLLKENNEIKMLAFFKAGLAWAILLVMLILLFKSEYGVLIKNVLMVVYSKL